MKKKIDFNALLENNQFLIVLSLLSAVMIWFIVVYNVDKSTTRTINNVPVTLNLVDSMPGRLGLSPITKEGFTTDVTITGDRAIIGNVSKDDILISAGLSSVSGPGTYELYLEGTDFKLKGFEVAELNPKMISVRFDHVVTKKFPVTLELTGLNIPEGYVMDKEYASPTEVSITAPATEMERIDKCVVKIEFDEPLSKTTTYESEIQVVDGNGEKVDATFLDLDETKVSVTIPVLKKKTVPITFDFVNEPPGFDPDTLRYTISPSEIEVAGPEASVDSYTELHLGYVDVRTLTPDVSLYYSVSLPPSFISVENVQDVNVTFDPKGYTSKKFNVTDIRLVNAPHDYDVRISSKAVSSVEVYGPQEVIQNLAAKDIVAEIDMTNAEIKVGQVTVPVDICIPTQDSCWAYGDYTAVITVKEKK